MTKNKKLHIYKDQNILEITLRWFKTRAYFFAFFSVFWIGFLIAWYFIAIGSGAPAFAFIVPLIHVAVGVGMGYYTLCLFLNKTYVDIAEGFLTVHHAPIPWWKGNKTIPVEKVEQLYVKEKVSRGKNSKSYTYVLRAKLRNGKDLALLDINHASSEQMQEIEAELENFLGIPDVPVASEYTRGRKPSTDTLKLPRRHRPDFTDHPLGPIFSAAPIAIGGTAINIKNKPWKVASITQYDWNDGNSDKLFQLTDDQYKEDYLFLRQIKGLLYAYHEQSMPATQSQTLQFNPETPSAFFRQDGKYYNLSRSLVGKKFISGIREAIPVKQWLYTAETDRSYIRITDEGGVISFFSGVQLAPEMLTLGLDLNQAPPAEPLGREIRYDDEDLV